VTAPHYQKAQLKECPVTFSSKLKLEKNLISQNFSGNTYWRFRKIRMESSRAFQRGPHAAPAVFNDTWRRRLASFRRVRVAILGRKEKEKT